MPYEIKTKNIKVYQNDGTINPVEAFRGQKGQKGETGSPGSDASVTSENIRNALGYTPSNVDDVKWSLNTQSGSSGQYLKRTNTGAEWVNLPEGEGKVKDVKAGGSSILDSNGIANINAQTVNKALGYTAADNADLDQVREEMSDHEDRIKELENAPAPVGGVQDVQANGESVVVDGVANLPVASNLVYGLVKTNPTYGLKPTANGFIQTNVATNAYIDSRTYQNTIISPTNLDYAVKAALTDAKAIDYSDEEKASARERLGLSNKYELIESITLENDIHSIVRETEPNGTPYNFTRLQVDVLAKSNGANLHTVVNGVIATQSYMSGFTATTLKYSSTLYEVYGGMIRTTYHTNATENNGQASTISERNYGANVPVNSINKLEIYGNGSYNISAGSTIKIYGIRA